MYDCGSLGETLREPCVTLLFRGLDIRGCVENRGNFRAWTSGGELGVDGRVVGTRAGNLKRLQSFGSM